MHSFALDLQILFILYAHYTISAACYQEKRTRKARWLYDNIDELDMGVS